MKKRKRTTAPKTGKLYRKLWRLIDGAVADAFFHHPDYLTPKGTQGKTARLSIVKRVTGAMVSFSERSEKGRSGKAGG